MANSDEIVVILGQIINTIPVSQQGVHAEQLELGIKQDSLDGQTIFIFDLRSTVADKKSPHDGIANEQYLMVHR